MWYRVTEFQQKIIGIIGLLLFSLLFISILIESKLLNASPETLFIIIACLFIMFMVMALLSFWDSVRSAK